MHETLLSKRLNALKQELNNADQSEPEELYVIVGKLIDLMSNQEFNRAYRESRPFPPNARAGI